MVWKDLFILIETCSLFAAPSKGCAHRSLTIDTLGCAHRSLTIDTLLVSSSAISTALRTIPRLIRSPRVMRFRCQAPRRSEAWLPTSLQLSRPSSSRFPQCSLASKPRRCSLAIRQFRQFDDSTGPSATAVGQPGP